jgi:hypothetical protein
VAFSLTKGAKQCCQLTDDSINFCAETTTA